MNSEASPARPRIYVVEDDDAIARLITRTLHEFGYESECFRQGAALLARLAQRAPDLCLIDLGLPDVDGMQLLREVAERADCGVLIVTGRGHMVDRVMGLEMGADDYVVKPFEPRELIARVRSVLRRRAGASAQRPTQCARFSGWRFAPSTHELTAADGTTTALSTAESSVLMKFLQHPNQILTRDQLIGSPDLCPLDRSIDVRISRLRRKLEADPREPKLIKTVYGAGYLLSSTVEWG